MRLTPERLRRRILRAEIARPEEIVGCSEREIQEIERNAPGPLPASYTAFLNLAGRKAGRFMHDLTIFYPEILGLTQWAREDRASDLPDLAFVFMQRLGAVFMCFECDGSDDPPIYYWAEDTESIKKCYDSLWDFIESELRIAEGI